ncbi:MAG: 50S ribosomal protein L17 [Deltaproteobacteria bacterium]|nr:50S ribosomal protein L17 [Deltaproteobacteria bacterium]
MRHLVDNKKFGRMTSARVALFRNMVTSLILHERMETTLPKAKELRRYADRVITLGKKGTLHARRQAAAFLMTPEAVAKLFDGLSARFKDRPGGYTRIFQLGYRRGDAAPMAMIEYLPGPEGRLKKEKKVPQEKPAKASEPKKAASKADAPKKESFKAKGNKGAVKTKGEAKKSFFSRLTSRSNKES